MRNVIRLLVVSMLVMQLLGCVSGKKTSPEEPAVAAVGATESYEEFVPYTEFDDIAVPNELSRVPERTFIYENKEFKTGMIVMKGRVENQSLIDFFVNQMAKDNWTKESSIISSMSTIVFKKPYKSCMIRITDGSYNTEVEIYAVELKAESLRDSGGVHEQNIK
ncbi:hypothetical protein [Maridesulfovibrio ferrireducens]|uniref:hypothetical protein n=1 Tax=Maridesulfovibrio ferrireducens TaxID=246191 RepID=UPI001A2E9AB4|nr:hypothetical protein [Maridesulfovibrio ferrireducens]MBI9111208.1 hypothetical protein [Maridesulfovibrio ferrireducens]